MSATPSHRSDLTQAQMHFRRGAEDGIDQHQSDSRQGVEAASEFVADQTTDGNVMDQVWWEKKPNHGRSLFALAGRAPPKNRPQTIRDLF